MPREAPGGFFFALLLFLALLPCFFFALFFSSALLRAGAGEAGRISGRRRRNYGRILPRAARVRRHDLSGYH
jgi:hypothetical protein